MGGSEDLTLLLVLEARDKAAKIIDEVVGKVKGYEDGVKAASGQATRSAAEIEAANDKAAAAAASYDRAVTGQTEAQAALRESMLATKAAQVEADAAVREGAVSVRAAAEQVKVAASEEEAALIRLQEAERLVATRSKEMAEAQTAAAAETKKGGAALTGIAVAAGATALAVGYIGDKAIHAAADFESSTTRLMTSAGEIHDNIDKVRQGMLQMAGDVGDSTEELSKAMYVIESGGQHGADGLEVLRAAAEGAKTENADLKTVADAVTTTLVDYHLKAGDAATVTSKLVAATSAGKTTFEELAGSLHSVLPNASSAHVSLNDILGDLAAMTIHGMSAQQAAQNLNDVLNHMKGPTAVQAKELALLGMTTNQLADDLKTKGLSGTLQEISDRIRKLSPPGTDKVILDLRTALQGLSPAVQELGMHLFDGTMTAKAYAQAAQALDPISAKQAMSFATLAGATHRIGDQQLTGAQVMQNYGQALIKATGDSTGLNVALMLAGDNADTANTAIGTVAAAATEAGNHVRGWGDIQSTFNFKLDALKGKLEASKIAIGTGLLPAVTSLASHILSVITPVSAWMTQHQHLTAMILVSVVALSTLVVTIAAVVKSVALVKLAWEGLTAAGGKLAPVTNIFKLAMTEATTAMATAGPGATRLGTALAGIQGGAKGAASGFGALLGSINPVMLGLTVATVAAGYFIQQAAEQKAKVDSLAQALMSLGQAYRSTHDLSSQAVRDVVLQNKDLSDLITKTSLYGLTVDAVTRATAGERDAQTQVIAAMQAKRDILQRLVSDESAHGVQTTEKGKADKKALDALNSQIDALKQQFDQLNKNSVAQQALDDAQKNGAHGANTLTDSDKDLVAKLDALRKGNVDAATASDTLKAAQDRLYGQQIAVTDATQNASEAALQFSQALKDNGNHWDLNSEAGIRNRQSLEAALKATVDLYQSQIAAKVPEDQATAAHDRNVDALRKQAKQAGLTDDQIQQLIDTYGTVPSKVTTELAVMGYANASGQLNSIGQIAANLVNTFGIDVQTAANLASSGLAQNKPHPHAAGGAVFGAGTETSDSILALLSNNEHVWTAQEVRAAGGHGAVKALRQAALAGKIGGDGAAVEVPAFAGGGQVGPIWDLIFQTDMSRWPAFHRFMGNSDAVVGAIRNMVGGGHAAGGPVVRTSTFDSGGPLYPGYTLAHNGTGSTEWVSKERPQGGGAATTVNININEPHIMSDRDVDWLIDRIDKRLVRTLLPSAGVQVRR